MPLGERLSLCLNLFIRKIAFTADDTKRHDDSACLRGKIVQRKHVEVAPRRFRSAGQTGRWKLEKFVLCRESIAEGEIEQFHGLVVVGNRPDG